MNFSGKREYVELDDDFYLFDSIELMVSTKKSEEVFLELPKAT